MKRLAVLTSGGDAPGMNAAIRAVARKTIYEGRRVFGIRRGFQGLLNGEMDELLVHSVGDIIHRGGTILGTARFPQFVDPAVQQEAAARLRAWGLEGLVVIGGGGSLRGAAALARLGVPVIGVPATIDNDVSGTDYAIGFDTAVNTVLDAINRVRDTATAHGRAFVIETMGRDCGFIALTAGLAGGAEVILIPEVPFDLEQVCRRVTRSRERGKRHSIILVAEGAARGFDVGQAVSDFTGQETRVSVLGYLQRGGTPTAFDRLLASRYGAAAVEWLLAGRSGCMTALVGQSVAPVPLEEAVGEPKRLDTALYRLAMELSI